MSDKYNIDWLREKGFFRKVVPMEIGGQEIFVDKRQLLAYVEINANEDAEKMKKEILSQRERIKYIWFFFPDEKKLKVFRRVGEVKWFYYSPNIKNESLKSKQDKLNQFSPDNMNCLFDTRDIVNRFYLQLWESRISMAKDITEIARDANKLLAVQRFIDRLIFFYFLAQLRLVKIRPQDGDTREWILDRKNTRKFFQWICEQVDEDDLKEFFNRLFFDVLGKVNERGFVSETFTIGGKRFSIESPCLNGGLFVESYFEGVPEKKIKISGAKIKELILNVLNKYNWIIGEDIPDNEDVIGDLTPEIIGHIYEKFVVSLEKIGIEKIKLDDKELLKTVLKGGRKKIGAYYTPEEITNYISMNTIYPYIKGRLREKFGENGDKVFNSLFEKEEFDGQELKVIKYIYFEILTKIKTCDNACGSGSFLIAAGDVLLGLYSRILKILEKKLNNDRDVRQVLEALAKSPTKNYYIVRQIIVNNLYGVDIMDGAVEIAKLRFWLWLISQVDPTKIKGKRIETLPNLDFNLMVGNSLIGFIDIEDVDFSVRVTHRGKKTTWRSLEDRYYPITEYSGNGPKSKHDWLKKLAKQKQEFKTMPSHEASKLKKDLDKELKEARKELNEKFYNFLKEKGIGIRYKEFLKLKPFHWGFEFYEVFDLEKPKEERGFDIIIGNPPYVQHKYIKGTEKKVHRIIFKSCVGQYDYLVLFIERGIEILNKYGLLGYITSNKFLASEYGSGIREMLFNQANITKIIDISNYQVFKDANTYPILLFLKNSLCAEDPLFIGHANDEELSNDKVKYVIVGREFFPNLSNDYVITTAITGDTIEIMGFLSKLEKLGKSKTDLISCGIAKTGYRKQIKKYGQFDATQQKSIKRILEVADIYRFGIKNCDKWILPSTTTKKKWSDFNSNKIVIAGMGLHLRASYDVSKSALGRVYYIKDVVKDKLNLNPKVLVLLLNSKTLNFYFSTLYFAVHQAGGHIRVNKPYLLNLPIWNPPTQQPFITLCDYMLFLNSTEERREREKEAIEFIDTQIIDSLVYELYFKEKFCEDGRYPEPKEYLLGLVSEHLKPINYDRWSELYWKKQFDKLNGAEAKEMRRLENENLKVISEVVERIRNDKEILEQVKRIKSHQWVKVIESGE